MPSRSIRLKMCSSTRFLRGTVTLSAAARFSSRRATRSVHPEISRQCCPGVYRKRSGLSRYVQSAEETARIGKARKADRNHFFMGSVLRGYDHSSKRSRQTTNTKEPYCRPGYSPPRREHQHTCRIQGGRICNQQFGIADLEYIQPDFLQPQRSLLLKVALENFLYIFQIGDSKLLIADPPSLDSANMLMPWKGGESVFPNLSRFSQAFRVSNRPPQFVHLSKESSVPHVKPTTHRG